MSWAAIPLVLAVLYGFCSALFLLFELVDHVADKCSRWWREWSSKPLPWEDR